MKIRSASLLASLLSLGLAAACATDAATDGDLSIGDATADDLGKADHAGLPLTRLSPSIGLDRLEEGGRVIITTASSWESYFSTSAPAEVDWSREWIAFYGTSLRSTGGFDARIPSIRTLEDGGLLIETEAVSPGVTCLVTQALTSTRS